MKKYVLAPLALVALAACGGGDDDDVAEAPAVEAPATTEAPVTTMPPTSGLETAQEECGTDNPVYPFNYGTISDDGHTYTMENYSGPGVRSYVDQTAEFECVITVVGMPQAVLDQVSHTRALDGLQTATWDDYTAQWTYHPDDGMWMTIEEG